MHDNDKDHTWLSWRIISWVTYHSDTHVFVMCISLLYQHVVYLSKWWVFINTDHKPDSNKHECFSKLEKYEPWNIYLLQQRTSFDVVRLVYKMI